MKRTSLINRAPPLERHYTINQMLHALFQVHRRDIFFRRRRYFTNVRDFDDAS
jgi:hypothetical protein